MEIASIQKIRDLMSDNKPFDDAVGEINHLAYKLSEEGPRPSFVGSFIEPKLTRVLHRGSPENPRDVVLPGAPKIFPGIVLIIKPVVGPVVQNLLSGW